MGYMQILKNRGYQRATRGYRLGVLKHFFNYQIELDNRTDNPAKLIKIKGGKVQKVHTILSKEDLESLYNNYQLPKEDDLRNNRNWWRKYVLSRSRNKVVLSLMIHQGITTAEVERISVKDLQLKDGKLYVQGTRKKQ